MHCRDCGCKCSGGTCSNCDEELWIETYQGEFMVGVTDEWEEKVEEQKARRKERLEQKGERGE